MIETKTVIKVKLQLTGNALWPVLTKTPNQIVSSSKEHEELKKKTK